MEIVQVYLQDIQASARVPRWKLVTFRPVDLQPDQTQTLRFRLSPKNLTFIDQDGNSRLEPGAFRLFIGGCSPDVRLSTASFAEMSFNLIDSTQLARRG